MKNLYRNTASLYDIDSRDNLHDDIPFYIEYAQKLGGEVLELGCGTGRVSLALARKGINVTGLDLSSQMLDVFKQKLTKEHGLSGSIKLVHGDMADFKFNRKFSLVIAPFRAFQALTDDNDVLNSLACINKHLSDDGLFIVNVFKPFSVLDGSWCYEECTQWERLDEETGNYVIKKHWGDKIDIDKQIIYPHFAYYVTDKNGKTTRETEDLSLKYYYEKQLEDILTKAGFEITERFGWYDKKPIAEANRELIFVCRRNRKL